MSRLTVARTRAIPVASSSSSSSSSSSDAASSGLTALASPTSGSGSGSPRDSDLFGITVRVFSAESLIAADLNGKSDPYVIINLDGNERHSKIIKKTLNPTWNETFSFVLSGRPKLLKLQVMDWDGLSKNDPLGDCQLELEDVLNGESFDSTLPLRNVKSGLLHFSVEAHVIQQARTPTEPQHLDIKDVVSMIDLCVVGASGLKSADFLSKSDPFAVVAYGTQSFRTPSVSNCDDPQWEQFCPLWVKRDTTNHWLKITVYDDDGSARPNFLGTALIKPSTLVAGRRYHLFLPLQKQEPLTDASLNATSASQFSPTEIPSGPSVCIDIQIKSKEEAERAFHSSVLSTYDTDGNGSIDEDELIHMCQTIDADITDEDIHEAFISADKECSGSLTIERLHDLFRHTNFTRKDFLRKVYSAMIHGTDSLQHLMLKNFLYKPQRRAGEESESSVPSVDSQILVQDRATGLVVRENIPTYIKSAMRLMFRTIGGRKMVQSASMRKTLRNLTVSQGAKMDNPKSKQSIAAFIKTHNLNVDEVEKPVSQYATFNEFFFRGLKRGARTCDAPDDDAVAVSPADCRMMVFETIQQSKDLWIKGENFSVESLFGPWDPTGERARLFQNGALVIARLAPQDYHRWHYPVSGVSMKRHMIDGDYFTVNPIAIRKPVDVYTDNRRCICPIQTEKFGLVVLVAVGAAMVGSINFADAPYRCTHPDSEAFAGKRVKKFDEHGYFAFGGSTCLVLFQPDAIALDKDLLKNSANQLETLVKVGARIGVATGTFAA